MGHRYPNRAPPPATPRRAAGLADAAGTDATRPPHKPLSPEVFVSPGLVLVIAASFTGVMGVQLISPALPAIRGSMGLSTMQTGGIVSAYSFAALLATLPAGYLGDRLGVRRLLGGAVTVFGLTGMAGLLARSYPELLGCRVLQGVAYSAIVPLSIAALVESVPRSRMATAQSYRVAAMATAEFLLPLLAGVLVASTGGWRVVFALFALPALLGPLLIRHLPDHGLPAGRAGWGHGVRSALSDARVASLLAVGFVRWWLKYAFFTYLPLYLVRDLHAAAVTVGALLAVQGLVGAAVATQAGRLGLGRASRLGLVAATTLLGLAIAMLGVVQALWWTAVVAVLLGLADGVVGPTMNSLVGDVSAAQVRGTVIALSGVTRNVGKAVSPVAAGAVLAATGYRTGFALVGVVGLLAPGYLWPLLRGDTPNAHARAAGGAAAEAAP